jgi:mRNA-degrading endonuclease RelE of RelBE toxin-antitoxin system
MAGSQKYLTVPTKNFERWLKKLIKRYKGKDKQTFQRFIAQLIEHLCINPRPSNSALEPIPGKMSLPQALEFRKLRFAMPNLRGASGQGRLMYLINSEQKAIVLVWIYTHEEFEGRPEEKSLATALQDAIDPLPEEIDPLPEETEFRKPRSPLLIQDLGWTPEQVIEARSRLLCFEEDWNAPGMEIYDDL